MASAVKLFGKVSAGFVDTKNDSPQTTEWAERLASIPLSRMSAKQAPGKNVVVTLRSPLSLAGNSHMLGVASLFPLRTDLAEQFRPTHLADSTDLFTPSFDIRGPVCVDGIEAHLTFTVEKTDSGEWEMYQVTPTSGYPGVRIECPILIQHVASTSLLSVTSHRMKAGLPWEPGVLVAGSKVLEALRSLCKTA